MGDAPHRIGSYEILHEIGRGGMGVVHLARDTRLGREVAIKGLPEGLTRDEERLARFRREARLLASLNHPYIATVHSLEEVDGRTYLVLEFVDGDPLFAHLERSGRTWRDCARVGAEIAEALAAAHEEGVVHRDIKPDNIMFTRGGITKVLDFGLAIPVEGHGEDGRLTQEFLKTAPGAIFGTPGYMAPEQARGHATDARSDIFAFGCVLHEMLAGEPTFVRDTAMDTIAATLGETPRPLADVPEDLGEIVMRCLAKEPDGRPASAGEVAAELRALLSAPTAPIAKAPPVRPKPRRALIAGLLVLLAAGVLLLTQIGGDEERDLPSLAVLQFHDLAAAEDLGYVARELPAGVIGDLSSLSGLRVLPRSTTFRYDVEDDPVEVGRALSVGYVLHGYVDSRGGRPIVRADLIDVKTNSAVWSQAYPEVGDLLIVVDDITERILERLELEPSETGRARLARRRPTSEKALMLYYRGRYELGKDASYLPAVDFFLEATEVDPTFALAYAGLADAYSMVSLSMSAPAAEVMPKAVEAAREAVRQGPELPETHSALGLISWLYEWDYEKAAGHHRDAMARDPRYAHASHWLAHALASQGRFEDGVHHERQAIALDPHRQVYGSCLGHHLVWAGHRQAGIDQLRETAENMPGFQLVRLYLGRMLAAGDTAAERQEAVDVLEKVSLTYARGDLGWALARNGEMERAREELEKLEALQESGTYIANVVFAKIHAGLGNVDETLAYLDKAVDAKESWLPMISATPHFQFLKGDARFVAILEKINLEP